MQTTNYERRKKRKKQTAEDFTPLFLINEMLDKLPEEVWEEDKTCCDPACGNGNMLVEVLKRKLKKGHDPLRALQTIYGVDIMSDNIKECRLRLLKLVSKYAEITIEYIKVVYDNIVFTSTTPTIMHPKGRYPNGALDYSFKFPHKASTDHVQIWLNNMKEWLEKVDIDRGIISDLKKVDEQQIESENGEEEDDYPRLFDNI
jgi:hypothetical protein